MVPIFQAEMMGRNISLVLESFATCVKNSAHLLRLSHRAWQPQKHDASNLSVLFMDSELPSLSNDRGQRIIFIFLGLDLF